MSSQMYFDPDQVGRATALTRGVADYVGEVQVPAAAGMDQSTQACAAVVAALTGAFADTSQELTETRGALEQSIKHMADTDKTEALAMQAIYPGGVSA